MPRFTGNSFKSTPFVIESDKRKENLDFIAQILNEYKFNPANIPTKGWVDFQIAKEEIDAKRKIAPRELPDGEVVLATTAIEHILRRELKSIFKSKYDELPLDIKYKTTELDFILYKSNGKIYGILSTSNQKTADYFVKNYLKYKPFSEYGFSVQKFPDDTRITSDFIYWLMYQRDNGGAVDSNISIRDLNLANANPANNLPINLEYDGEKIMDYVPELKYSATLNRDFNKIGLRVDINTHLFEFKVDVDGCVEFYANDCEYYEDAESYMDRDISKIVYIYKTLIPSLLKRYKDDKKWGQEKEKFIKKAKEECKQSLE